MLRVITTIGLLVGLITISSAQQLEWAKSAGGNLNDLGRSVQKDASGNIIVMGRFEGTADFDPGAGIAEHTAVGGFDIYIQKLDANGDFLWAKTFGGNGIDSGNSIFVDGDGNICASGYFSETVDFDPGSGSTQLTSAGGLDIFVLKLDANGDFLWVKQMGSFQDDVGVGTYVDPSGNVYSTGHFKGTVDFDPSAGTVNHSAVGDFDTYVLKLDASGNYVWAQSSGGNFVDVSMSIVADASGNVYTTGYYTPPAGSLQGFVQKLDNTGSPDWIKFMSGSGLVRGESIAIDGSGNTVITGFFGGTGDFDPSAGTLNLTATGGVDIFIAKMNPSGDTEWANSFGSTGWDIGRDVTFDNEGNIYTTGYFTQTADFDPGVGEANLVSSGGGEIFIQKLNPLGEFVWAISQGSIGADEGLSVLVDQFGDVYSTGFYEGTVDFDTLGTTLTVTGGRDIFVQKINQCNSIAVDITTNLASNGVTISANNSLANYQWINCDDDTPVMNETNQNFTPGANGDYAVILTQGSCVDTSSCVTVASVGLAETNLNKSIVVYPNPSKTGVLNIKTDMNIERLYLTDLNGKMMFTDLNLKDSVLDISTLDSGIYLLNIIAESGKLTERIIIE